MKIQVTSLQEVALVRIYEVEAENEKEAVNKVKQLVPDEPPDCDGCEEEFILRENFTTHKI